MPHPYYKAHWIDIDAERHALYEDFLKFHPAMERLIEPLKLCAGLRVLDAGSGPGHTAVEIARRVMPGGHVTGADINAEFIARSQSRVAAMGLSEVVDFIYCTFPPLPFADGSFDRVWCKNVLEYVDDARVTVAEMARVTAPGGIVVSVDSDWDMMALELGAEAQARSERIVAAAKAVAMNEPRIGRRLFHHYLAAGLRDVEVRVFANPDRKGFLAGMLRSNIGRYALDSGRVARAEMDEWLSDVEHALANQRFFCMLPQFVVSGRKPTPAGG